MGAALDFWKRVVEDQSGFIEAMFDLLDSTGIRYCVIGGVAVNAYARPYVLTEDVDLAVAVEDIDTARDVLSARFKVRQFEHSLNVYDPHSKLQFQLQLDPEFAEAVPRATRRRVLDLDLPIASPEDLLRFKVAAALEPRRRPSKRRKDYGDIERMIETFPHLRDVVPASVLEQVEASGRPPASD